MNSTKEALIVELKKQGILRSQQVEDALRSVDRASFLWGKSDKTSGYIDEPLPLGKTGQTISAPHMIVSMLEELELTGSIKVLEVGCGSGYNAALIAHIVCGSALNEECKVLSIERDSTLVEFARSNLSNAGYDKAVKVIEGDGSLGYPQESREELYDRIIVTAGAPHVPLFLKYQLRPEGILLIPVGPPAFQKLIKLRKNRIQGTNSSEFSEEELMTCAFVPLIGADAHYF